MLQNVILCHGIAVKNHLSTFIFKSVYLGCYFDTALSFTETTASKPGTSSTKDKDSMNRVSPKYSSGNQNGGNGKSNQNAECTLVPPQTNLQSLHEIGKRCPHIFNDKKTSETFIR